MSTSNLNNELFDGWGWGEVVSDGESDLPHIACSYPNLAELDRLRTASQVGIVGKHALHRGAVAASLMIMLRPAI